MSRATSSELTDVVAECCSCAWRSIATNALGNAARHHDATNHAVITSVTRRVVYGDPSAPLPGQETLELEAGV